MAKKSSIRITKQHIFIGIGVVVLIASAVGVGVLVRLLQNSATPTDDTQNGQTQGFLEDRLPTNIKEAQNLASSGKVEEANSKLEADIKKATQESNNDAKYDALFQLSLNHSNQGNYKKAIEVLQQAEAIKEEFALSRLMGDYGVEVNDKTLAIKYYKKAVEQIDNNNPMGAAEKQKLQTTIKGLGG